MTDVIDVNPLEDSKIKTPDRVVVKENDDKLLVALYNKSSFAIGTRVVGLLFFVFIVLNSLDRVILPLLLVAFMTYYLIMAMKDRLEIVVDANYIVIHEVGWLMKSTKSIPIKNLQFIKKGEMKIARTVGRSGHSNVTVAQPILLMKTQKTSYKFGMDNKPSQILFMIPLVKQRVTENFRKIEG